MLNHDNNKETPWNNDTTHRNYFTRHIPKDCFIRKDKNEDVHNKDPKEWDLLYEGVMQEIENNLVLAMVHKTQ